MEQKMHVYLKIYSQIVVCLIFLFIFAPLIHKTCSMKSILLTLGSPILTIALYAGVVKGNIGQGTFVDYSNEPSQAYGLDLDNHAHIQLKISHSCTTDNCQIHLNPTTV